MSSVEVRIPAGLVESLFEELRRPGPRERVVFALASRAFTPSRDVVIFRELIVPPESAFLPSVGHGARWTGAYMFELLNRALERNLGLFIVHAHGWMDPVQLSADDQRSAKRLLPTFQLVAPSSPHGSIVLGGSSCAGMILLPDETKLCEDFAMRMLGDRVVTWPEPEATPSELRLFERQALAANQFVERKLERATAVVVGLSGGGSQVVGMLAALGIGQIFGIDDQVAEPSNLYATPFITWSAAQDRWPKTEVAADLVARINPRVRFEGIRARVPQAPTLDALKSADVIVGCMNNLHARADLMEIAWRYCIPYVDIGLVISTDPKVVDGPPPITSISGNVFTAIPGRACLWCTEFLTEAKLEAEAQGRGRSYLTDAVERDAYVLPFNATLSGQATSEVLQLLVGFARPGVPASYKRFDGFAGTLCEWTVTKNVKCSFCARYLGAGDPIWTASAA